MMNQTRTQLSMLAVALLWSVQSLGQVIFPDDFTREYYRLLMLKDTTLVDPITLNPSIITSHSGDEPLSWDIWEGRFKMAPNAGEEKFSILNPTMNILNNSDLNRGFNDGAAWKGRGLNVSMNFGVTGQIGKFRYTVAPTVYYAQNRRFNIPSGISQDRGNSEFSYPFFRNLDYVQRFGDGAVAEIHPGQFELRFIHKKFTVGVSTENMIWGPARFNPIVMSTNAGGFPHLDIGTITPVPTKIGEVEFRTFWGVLNESDHYDENDDNQTRYISGFTLGYRPKFIKGFNFGINRILYTRLSDGDLGAKDAFIPFLNFFINNADSTGISRTNDEYDQIMSASIRYEFPESGLEAYMEYAYNDFPGNINDLIEQPDRTRAIMWGFVKTFDMKHDRLLTVAFEHTSVSKSRTATTFPHPSYYVHGQTGHGYTERGQLIGAGIGPGSNSDYLEVNYYTQDSRWSFHFQRIRYNDDYLFANFAHPDAIPTDFSGSLGLSYIKFVSNFSLNPYFVGTYRNNWFFNDDIETENYQFGFRLGYLFN